MPGPDDGTMAVVPPHLFTQRKRVLLLEAFKAGQTVRGACARAGISNQTYYEHYNNEPEFAEQCDRARAESEAKLVDAITKSAHSGETVTTPGGAVTVRPGDWRAAAWLLEHHPATREQYAGILKSKVQMSGDPDGPPVQLEVEGQEMSTLERMAAVVTVLQRAGVMPIPEPGETKLIDVTPDASPSHEEAP